MKKLIFVFVIALSCISGYSQDDLYFSSAEDHGMSIPKRANTIIVTDTAGSDHFIKIVQLLAENGYGVLSSDRESGVISSTEKSFKKGIIKLTIFIKNKEIMIRGQYNMQMTINLGEVSSDMGWTEVVNFGMKKSPNLIAWNEMKKFADQIPGTQVYLIK